MNKFFTTLLTLAALAIAIPASAQDLCKTSEPEIDTGETGFGHYYADNDPCQPGCIFSFWVYQESNGLDGLQRGDEVQDDTNGGACYPADTIIF